MMANRYEKVESRKAPLHHSFKQFPKQKSCQNQLPKLPKQTEMASPSKCAKKSIPQQILHQSPSKGKSWFVPEQTPRKPRSNPQTIPQTNFLIKSPNLKIGTRCSTLSSVVRTMIVPSRRDRLCALIRCQQMGIPKNREGMICHEVVRTRLQTFSKYD